MKRLVLVAALLAGCETNHVESVVELRPRPEFVDSAGAKHVVHDQYRNGVRVLGAEGIRHSDRPDVIPDLSLVTFDDRAPEIDRARAEELAKDALRDQGAEVVFSEAELVYERGDAGYVLAWHVDLSLDAKQTDAINWRVSIDPVDGRITARNDVTPTYSHHATGHSRDYGQVTLNTFVHPQGLPYERYGHALEDRARPRPGDAILTLSELDELGDKAATPLLYLNVDGQFGNGRDMLPVDFTSVTNGPLSPTGETAAVDTHFAAGWAWDLYWAVFARPGPYGDGSGFRNIVHHAGVTAYDRNLRSVYVAQAGQQCPMPPTSVAVVAHELGHAFFGSEIRYSSFETEAAAMDEAVADIFGKLTEMFQRTPTPGLPSTWQDWTFRFCGAPLRYLHRPSLDGFSYDAWHSNIDITETDPHHLNGPINRMFHFLAEGVAPAGALFGETSGYLPNGLLGIGIPAAADILYRGLVGHLTPRYNPLFADLRAAMIDAASTVEHRKAVEDAFAAVNVGQPADRVGPSINDIPTLTAPGVSFMVSVTDPSGVKSVEYGAWGTAQAAPWAISVPSNLASGNHWLEICATDLLDNRACVNALVKVDAQKPTIFKFSLPNPFAPINSRTVELEASDGAGPLTASIYLQEHNKPFARLLWETKVKGRVIDVDAPILIPTSIAEGVHQLGAEVADPAGNVTTATIPLVWDKSPPNQCEIFLKPVVGPSDWFDVGVSDAVSGIDRVDIYWDSVLLVSDPFDWAGGKQGLSGARYPTSSVGTHTAKAVCVDKAGYSTTTYKTVTVNALPNVSITNPSQASSPTQSATFTVKATDGDGVERGYVSINCSASGLRTLDSFNGSTSTTYQRTFTVSNLVVGETCWIRAEMYDRFNLQSWSVIDFTVQYVAPPPQQPTPVCNSMLNSGGNSPASYTIDVGARTGKVNLQLNTYSVPDILTVSCADGGTINSASQYSTGCASTHGWASGTLTINCASSRVRVTVSPDCHRYGNTDWSFILGCATRM